jgi:hypothetical protein
LHCECRRYANVPGDHIHIDAGQSRTAAIDARAEAGDSTSLRPSFGDMSFTAFRSARAGRAGRSMAAHALFTCGIGIDGGAKVAVSPAPAQRLYKFLIVPEGQAA